MLGNYLKNARQFFRNCSEVVKVGREFSSLWETVIQVKVSARKNIIIIMKKEEEKGPGAKNGNKFLRVKIQPFFLVLFLLCGPAYVREKKVRGWLPLEGLLNA